MAHLMHDGGEQVHVAGRRRGRIGHKIGGAGSVGKFRIVCWCRVDEPAVAVGAEVDRDVSFLRRFLTEELMREMDMFQYEPQGEEYVISQVSDKDGWRAVKETLLKNVGMGGIPTIKIEDADYGRNRVLYLKHYHDGRDLQLEYAEQTLAYLERLWGHETVLETTVNGANMILSYSDKGFTAGLR